MANGFLTREQLIKEGGKGSGFFGHAGRPDKRGGSQARGANSVKLKKAVEKLALSIWDNPIETAYVLDGQGNVIFSADGDETSFEFSIKDMAKLKDAVVVHNHPGRGPSPFSCSDFILASANNVREIHAVSHRGDKPVLFSMYRTEEGGWPSTYEGKVDLFKDLEDAGFPTKPPAPDASESERIKRLERAHTAWETVLSRGYYNNHSGSWRGKFIIGKSGEPIFDIPKTLPIGVRYEMKEL